MTSCPGDSNHQLVMMKGAPEIILGKCTHHLHNKQEKEIDDVSSNLCKERSVCLLAPAFMLYVWFELQVCTSICLQPCAEPANRDTKAMVFCMQKAKLGCTVCAV